MVPRILWISGFEKTTICSRPSQRTECENVGDHSFVVRSLGFVKRNRDIAITVYRGCGEE
jgi:hypothetical protein